ncbi:MAG: hypothetical protein WB474_01195 [Nitrososphaeraceae archaeon]
MKYIFPDDGTHQVILRVDSKHLVELASFQVFVHDDHRFLLNVLPRKTFLKQVSNESNGAIDEVIVRWCPYCGVKIPDE